MNLGYDRHVIARGLDAVRIHSIEEIANDCGIPPSYLHSMIVERADDFGDVFVGQLVRAAGTTVEKVLEEGR